MQALRIHEHGGPEVLKLEAVADPVPASGACLVRIRACALNHLDLFVRQGIPGVTIALPRILGSDIAGERADTGAPVIVAPGWGCGRCPACLDGRDNECKQYEVLGYQRDGGYCEQIAVEERNLIPAPVGLSFVEAASMPLVFLTAWNMLVRKANIQPGQKVLVWAASSGVGIAAVQIAKLFGCLVAATAGSAEKMALARALGADEVFNHYGTAPLPRNFDIVIEHTGQATWDRSLRALAPGGVLVTCGATTGYEATIDLRFLFSRQLRLMGSYMGRRADLDTVVKLIDAGKLRPIVDRVFPLADGASAHAYLEAKRQFGKVVLQVA